jgi:LiaF transmembrane domain
MKAKHVFWGFLFVSLGVLILINNFSGLYWDWVGLWKLWPLVFILWGLSIMVKNNAVKILTAGIAGIALAVSLFASFKTVVHLTTGNFNIVFDDDGQNYKYEFTEYAEPYSDSIQTAGFHFKAGAGSFTTEDDSTSDLFYAHTEGIKDNYNFASNVSGKNADISMEMKGTRIRIGRNNNIRNRVEMHFNPKPLWNLNFDVGAASVYLDLTPVKVEKLKVDMGAASLKVRFGVPVTKTDVDIQTGASKVELNIPQSAGCEIQSEGALNSKDFKGFKKISSDVYRTDNFDSTSKKIYIHIDAGVSSINIDRYVEKW